MTTSSAAGIQNLTDVPLEERVFGDLLDRMAATRGSEVFLRFHDETLSYGEVSARSDAVAAWLADQGVGHGDRVAMMFSNRDCLAFVATWFGVVKAGAIAVPINPEFKGDLLVHVLEDSEAVAVLAEGTFATLFSPALGGSNVSAIALSGEDVPEHLGGVTVEHWDSVISNPTSPRPDVRHSDVAAILYSSGTTGRPKGILMSHAHIHSFGAQWIRVMAYTSDDRLYSPTPLSYMLAMVLGVVPTLLVGSDICFAERFSSSRYWDDIREYDATVAHGIFSVIPILKKQPPLPLDRDHRCRAIYIAKSDEEFEERFGVRLVEIYGSTESNIVAYNPWSAPKPGSCGLPAPNFEVRVVDEDDRPLPQGEVGEIVSRPREPYLISYGYYKRADVTAEAWKNLWFHCGDRGYFDEDGYLFYVDRAKDVIRRRGENISASEVERHINRHPSVLESAVVAVPSEVGEDEVMAFVVLTESAAERGAEYSELVTYWAETLPRFMVPRYAEFVSELPKTQSMKIRKVALRERGLSPDTFDRDKAGVLGHEWRR